MTATATLTQIPLEVQAASPVAWINANRIVTDKAEPVEFYDHPWMVDIFNDYAPEQVIIKGSQIGMSTTAILKIAHRCVYDRINTIYILPTVDMVRAFTPVKVDPILRLNHLSDQGGWDKRNSTDQKMIGPKDRASFVLFKGSWVEREGIMINADLLVYDEIDQCKVSVIETYESRLSASKLKWKWIFSTPSAPNAGVDAFWQKSDMKHWFIKCRSCGEWQFIDWPDSVDYKRGIFACTKCRAEITDNDRRMGEWIAKFPGRDMSGYWISQMIAPFISAAELIDIESRKEKQIFYNWFLGKAYAGSDINVSEATITRNLSNADNDRKDAVMGVDVGNYIFWVMANDTGIFDFGKADIRGLEDRGKSIIDKMITDNDIRCCVIDGRPETDMAQELAESYPYRVYLNYYHDRAVADAPFEFNDLKKIVVSDRARTIDRLVDRFNKSEIKMQVSPNSENFKEYLEHWENMYLKTETNRQGETRRVWDAVGGRDHFAHATTYCDIALARNKEWSTKREPIEQKDELPDIPDPFSEMHEPQYMNMDWYDA